MVTVRAGDTCVVCELDQELFTALHLCNSIRGSASFFWLWFSGLASVPSQGETTLLLSIGVSPPPPPLLVVALTSEFPNIHCPRF